MISQKIIYKNCYIFFQFKVTEINVQIKIFATLIKIAVLKRYSKYWVSLSLSLLAFFIGRFLIFCCLSFTSICVGKTHSVLRAKTFIGQESRISRDYSK